MFRVVWLTFKVLLSAVVGSLGLAMLLHPGTDAPGAMRVAGAFFAFLAAVPWFGWGTSASPVAMTPSIRFLYAFLIAVAFLLVLMLAGAIFGWKVGFLAHPLVSPFLVAIAYVFTPKLARYLPLMRLK